MSSPSRTLVPPGRWGWIVAGASAIAVLALIYQPALQGSFLWDDHGHVTRADLQSLRGLGRIWFEFGATQQYYPVLHSAFWLEHRLWGDAPIAYHVLNVALHGLAAVLFGRLLQRLRVPGGWLAAAAFAVHPVMVESVAWISEQKNTLATVFGLLAALGWLRFDASRRPRDYALATLAFLLALGTKTVTATLPAALLVIAWWRDGRLGWRTHVRPLVPWLFLSVLAGLTTAHFERELIGAQGADFTLGPAGRAVLAGRVAWFYLGKLLWPADLMFIYPRWDVDPAALWAWAYPLAVLAVLGGCAFGASRSRGPLAAILLFGGLLFPALGFVNVYPFVFSYVADHFQYQASLAFFAFAGAALVRLARPLPAWLGASAGALLLGGLAVMAWRQAATYRDPVTLYETTLARNPDCWMAHNNLATELARADRRDEAVAHLERALALRPDYPEALNNLADDWIHLRQPGRAVPLLTRALQLQPGYAVAHRNLGLAFATTGRNEDAIREFVEAARLDPLDAEAEVNWGLGLMLAGRFAEGESHFIRATQLAPGSATIANLYGLALARHGRPDDALNQFIAALTLDPDLAEAHLNAAGVLRQLGRTAEADDEYRLAVRLNPALAAGR